MNVSSRKYVKKPPKSKYREFGCGEDNNFQIYESVDFFIRAAGGDVKFRTEGLAMEWACRMNKAAGKVVATVVRKHRFKKWVNRDELIEDTVIESEKSRELFETYLKHGYITKGGKEI